MTINTIKAWNLLKPLLYFSEQDPFTIGDSCEGAFVFGQTGSGKSSGIGQSLAIAMLRAGYGGLVLSAKPGEAETWMKYARLTGRERDLVIVSPENRHRFNMLDFLYKSGGRGAGLTDNVVAIILEMLRVKDQSRGSGGDAFWTDSARQTLSCCIDLLGLAKETISFPNIAKLLNSAPTSQEELASDVWLKKSYLNAIVDRATANKTLSVSQETDLLVAVEYFLSQFPRMDDRTRSNILATVNSLTFVFTRGLLVELFGSTTNFGPQDTFEKGSIIVLDLPVKTFLEAGQFAQILFKTIWQKEVERRDVSLHPRPVVMFCDEFQNFVTPYDPIFQSTARSARVASVALTQNIDSIISRFPAHTGRAEAEALFGNYNLKVFSAQDHVGTNEWASKSIGQVWQYVTNTNASLGAENGSLSAGSSQQLKYLVDPIEFVRLRKGGESNNCMVDSIVFRSGKPFVASGVNHLHVSLPQNLR
ncbi:type IV secretory system conjugative DNA transfer family protein [Fimbriiglobus ruber]|uniref:TraD/TraG TraM recognition site domain-containing protein n=1 Tax=Fimbriiglobus ruber TaxID=1908690 RepID=A0A225DY67_9BACT|nr:type IV secretory system conjugative DNA transfer family protein [Fimbriiglobus ruber]OWK46480.1 hypothetical protein FRUB_00179 [Fimbriiglobus ruber]